MIRNFRLSRIVLLAAGIALIVSLAVPGVEAQQKVQVEFWHGLSQPEGGILEKVVSDFNASQGKYQVNAPSRGAIPRRW